MKTKTATVALTGIGMISPSANTITGLGAHCSSIPSSVPKIVDTIPPPQGMSHRDLRRLARLSCLALYASDLAAAGAQLKGRNGRIYMGLTHGSTSLLQEFHDFLFTYGPQMASPNAFSNGVTNAPLGAVSKYLGLTCGGGTFVGYENCGMDILHHAAFALAYTSLECCFAGAAEEYSSLVEDAYKKLDWYPGTLPSHLPSPINEQSRAGIGLSEGSVFCALCRKETIQGQPETAHCFFTPVDDIHTFNQDIDIVISGAGGGPQDIYELDALSLVLSQQNKPTGVLFSKCFFGETFAVGALLSAAMAWDILVNTTAYPSFPLHGKLKQKSRSITDFSEVTSILVLSASRDGQVSAGLFTKSG